MLVLFGYDLQPNWQTLGLDLQPNWQTLGSDLQPNWQTLGYDLQSKWQTLGYDLQPNWPTLGYDLQQKLQTLGYDLQQKLQTLFVLLLKFLCAKCTNFIIIEESEWNEANFVHSPYLPLWMTSLSDQEFMLTSHPFFKLNYFYWCKEGEVSN